MNPTNQKSRSSPAEKRGSICLDLRTDTPEFVRKTDHKMTETSRKDKTGGPSRTKMTVGIITLGCKVNQYESEAISEKCREYGLTPQDPSLPCDIYIVNSCSVTAEADRKSCQMIRRLLSRNPDAAMIVTGCSAQREAERIAGIPGVGYVVGNASKLKCSKICSDIFEGRLPAHPIQPIIDAGNIDDASFESMRIFGYPRTRHCIKIEDGCENRCSYCAIPDGRGRVRSKPAKDVVEEALFLCRGGCREIVLTGIEIASYGRDTGESLAGLLTELDRRCAPLGTRFRMSSVPPDLFSDEFIDSISGLRSLAPHFHISMQSASDRILGLMRRHYRSSDAYASFEKLRERIPGVMFSADIIVGFPGESPGDFSDTVDFVRETKLIHTHIFPYSRRNGTPAAEMPGQIPVDEKKRRAALLAVTAQKSRDEALSDFISSGMTADVLVERSAGGILRGHSGNYVEVCFEGPAEFKGSIVSVRPLSAEGGICRGELAVSTDGNLPDG